MFVKTFRYRVLPARADEYLALRYQADQVYRRYFDQLPTYLQSTRDPHQWLELYTYADEASYRAILERMQADPEIERLWRRFRAVLDPQFHAAFEEFRAASEGSSTAAPHWSRAAASGGAMVTPAPAPTAAAPVAPAAPAAPAPATASLVEPAVIDPVASKTMEPQPVDEIDDDARTLAAPTIPAPTVKAPTVKAATVASPTMAITPPEPPRPAEPPAAVDLPDTSLAEFERNEPVLEMPPAPESVFELPTAPLLAAPVEIEESETAESFAYEQQGTVEGEDLELPTAETQPADDFELSAASDNDTSFELPGAELEPLDSFELPAAVEAADDTIAMVEPVSELPPAPQPPAPAPPKAPETKWQSVEELFIPQNISLPPLDMPVPHAARAPQAPPPRSEAPLPSPDMFGGLEPVEWDEGRLEGGNGAGKAGANGAAAHREPPAADPLAELNGLDELKPLDDEFSLDEADFELPDSDRRGDSRG